MAGIVLLFVCSDMLRNLLIGRPVNTQDPATCAIKMELPAFAVKLAQVMLPDVMTAIELQQPASNDTTGVVAQSSQMKCYYHGAVTAISLVGSIFCILATWGKCTPVVVTKMLKTSAKNYVKTAYHCTQHVRSGGCMPGDALVLSESGQRVGDRFMSRGPAAGGFISPAYSDVYLLGHVKSRPCRARGQWGEPYGVNACV